MPTYVMFVLLDEHVYKLHYLVPYDSVNIFDYQNILSETNTVMCAVSVHMDAGVHMK